MEGLLSPNQQTETNSSNTAEGLDKIVNALQEVMQQFQIWHWNTRDFIHLATEEVYKGLIDPMDKLAEAYRAISKQLYTKENSPAYTSEFRATEMDKICEGIINMCNAYAAKCPEEDIKSTLSDVISIMRTAIFKIG